MKRILLILIPLIFLSGCASYQNYTNLSPRDKAFYNLIYHETQTSETFSALKTQAERDEFLRNTGYLQKFEALPEHVQSAIIEHEIVLGAPEFTIYMAAGKPIKQRRQISMKNDNTKVLYYLKCSDSAGANANIFVNSASTCPAKVSSALLSTLSPMPTPRDPLLAESIPYVVKVVDGKIESIIRVNELPQ